MDYGILREQIRLLVDPLLMRFKEELYGSGVSFGRIIPDALPTTIIYDNSQGDSDIAAMGYIKGITTLSGGTVVGTTQKELSFVNVESVISVGSRTTVTIPPRQLAWFEQGSLTTGDSKGPLRRLDADVTIVNTYIYVKTAPTGAAIQVDIKKASTPDGTFTTIFSATPSISVGTYVGSSSSFSAADINAGEYVRMDITQVGSTVAGSDLTVDLNMVAR